MACQKLVPTRRRQSDFSHLSPVHACHILVDFGIAIGSSVSSVVFVMEYFLSVLSAAHDREPAHPQQIFPKTTAFLAPVADGRLPVLRFHVS